MADEAPFQFLHTEVIQYIYKSADSGDTVRRWTCPLYTYCSLNVLFKISSLFCLGEWKKYHQTGEHGISSRAGTDRAVTS